MDKGTSVRETSRKIFVDRIQTAIVACDEEEKKTGSDYARGYKEGLVWVLDLLDALEAQPETQLVQ